jgi:hypothetical protein
MPRRGDHQQGFPPVPEPPAPTARVGIRLVRATDQGGAVREIAFDHGYVMSTVCECLAPPGVSPGDGLRVIACPRLIHLADVLLGRLPVGISGVVSAARNG